MALSITGYLFGALLCAAVVSAGTDISITLDSPVTTVSEKFMSIAIDSGTLGGSDTPVALVNNATFMALLKELAPGYLRIGGTNTERVLYTGESCGISYATRRALKVQYGVPEGIDYTSIIPLCNDGFDAIYGMAAGAGLRLFYNINVMLRDSDGAYDPTNVDELLAYAQEKDYAFDMHLGNEPNSFEDKWGVYVSPAQLATDVATLSSAKSKYANFKDSLLIGPDATAVGDFVEDFVDAADMDILSGVSWHMYYYNGATAVKDDYLNPTLMNKLSTHISWTWSTLAALGKDDLQFWLSETASAYSGGVADVSDRYIAGFMWMDELGLAAKLNVTVVARQAFVGSGAYCLLDSDFTPRPDYWLSVIYKRLVGTTVFDASLTQSNKNVRLYAHCAKNGGVVLFGENVGDSDFEGTFASEEYAVEKYLLTPGDNDLLSKTVLLNGEALEMVSSTELPSIDPAYETTSSIALPAQTYGFFVIPGLGGSACAQ